MDAARTPDKFADLSEIAHETQNGANKGQIMILFAIMLVGLIGILGLATDVGYAMAAKRSVQGAADAGALNGARMIARYTNAAPVSARPEIMAALSENTFGGNTPTILECQYLGAGFNIVGSCGQNVPSNAAGTRVQTRIEFNTFFMQIFPGVSGDMSATGYAKARVETAATLPRNAPLMICGTSAWNVSSNPGTTSTTGSSNLNILDGSNRVSQSAIGKTFRVVDPDLADAGNADCGSYGDAFTGIADTSANGGKSLGSRYRYSMSGSIGSTTAKLDGAGGCNAGMSAPFDCVMVLPIAAPGESSPSRDLRVVAYAAFQITSIDGVRFNATLVDDYITAGRGTSGWCRECGGVVVVRLIW
jgi:hypothetical protein